MGTPSLHSQPSSGERVQVWVLLFPAEQMQVTRARVAVAVVFTETRLNSGVVRVLTTSQGADAEDV